MDAFNALSPANLSMTDTADLIDQAVDNLESCSWGQGGGRTAMNQICAEDAVWVAVTESEPGIRIVDALVLDGCAVDGPVGQMHRCQVANTVEYALADHLGIPHGTLFQWNDEDGRTKEEVIEAFKGTSKDLRNRAVPTQ